MSSLISGATALIQALEDLGVTVIFGYPGGANLPFYDALRESSIKHVLTRHEQGAAFMANGYGRISGKPGVCLVTSGPGVTNAVTGIADAYQDSVPMLIITGQIPRKFIGTDAFQEVDCVNMTLPITKHNELIIDSDQTVPALRSGYYIANSGRKGPVLIDYPRDVVEEKKIYNLKAERILSGYKPSIEGNIGQVKRLLKKLAKAERALIVVGGGVHISQAAETVHQFAVTTNIPVVRTLMGKGVISDESPLFAGMIGTHGNTDGNKAISRADVIFAVGTRFGDRSTLQKKDKFCEGATFIHLDVDPAEIGKIVPTNIPIVGDIGATFELIWQQYQKTPFSFKEPWFKAKSTSNLLYSEDSADALAYVCSQVNHINQKIIITTDVGRHQMWATHCCTNPLHLPLLTSGGLGTMGFGLPAGIGAWFYEKKYPVINISGDGSFWMNMQELVVAVEQKVPLIVLLCNDNRLGMIRELQHGRFAKRYFGNDFSAKIDYIKLAESLGVHGLKVTDSKDVLPAIQNAIEMGTPAVIECDIFGISDSLQTKLKKTA